MVITKDTSLLELVQSDKVIGIISNVNYKLQSILEDRTSAIKNEIANGILNEEYIVDDIPIYNIAGRNVLDLYNKVKIDAPLLVEEISKAALQQHLKELEELIECLQKEIERLKNQIGNLRGEYNTAVSRINSANPSSPTEENENPSTSVTTSHTSANEYANEHGMHIEPSRSHVIYYNSESSDKSRAINSISMVYNHVPSGIISIITKFKEQYEQKLQDAIRKRTKVERNLNYMTSRFGPGEGEAKDTTKFYDKDGNVIGSIYDDDKDSNEIKSIDGDNQMTLGKEYYINGKLYIADRYIKLSDGSNKTIFKRDDKFYYIDSNGNPQQAFFYDDNRLNNSKWVIDGEEFSATDAVFTYSSDNNKSYTPNPIDSQYTQQDGYIKGDTLYYNGNKYQKVMLTKGTTTIPATVTTETGEEYELYGNGFGYPYYVANGEVHRATHKPGDTVDGFWQYSPADDLIKNEGYDSFKAATIGTFLTD